VNISFPVPDTPMRSTGMFHTTAYRSKSTFAAKGPEGRQRRRNIVKPFSSKYLPLSTSSATPCLPVDSERSQVAQCASAARSASDTQRRRQQAGVYQGRHVRRPLSIRSTRVKALANRYLRGLMSTWSTFRGFSAVLIRAAVSRPFGALRRIAYGSLEALGHVWRHMLGHLTKRTNTTTSTSLSSFCDQVYTG
jgi:hypothetical protein